MSTNKNNAAQTLFRFVSLRAPQLSNEKEQDKRFVLAPSSLKGNHFFKSVIDNSGVPKQKQLLDYSRTFENSPDLLQKEDLKTNFPDLYHFAVWVSRNKTNYTNDELSEKANEVKNSFISSEHQEFILQLWNNLIYQVTTQKDFYIKEVVMQLLLVIHIIDNLENEEENKILVNARIVLPKELMVDENSSVPSSQTNSVLASSNSYPSDGMRAQQQVAFGKKMLDNLENLQKDVSKIKKAYNKGYQAEYKIQEAAYKREIAPILESYNAEVAAAKQAYCETRNQEIEYNPEDPCNHPVDIPLPVLPEFEFQFREEVEATNLIDSLKEKNLETLLTIFDYEFPEEFNASRLDENQVAEIQNLLEGTSTFQELENHILESKEKFQNQVLNNTISNEHTYKSVGGIMIPLSKGSQVSNYFSICPKLIGRWTSYDLEVHLPDNTWDVSGISYTLTDTVNNTSFPSSNYYVKTKSGNVIHLNNLMASATTNGQTLLDFSYSLNILVTFTNGQTTQFTAVFENLKICDRGSFEIMGDESGNGNPEVITDNNNFIPSGFGFKNIGIADYLKVEQSTYCYVEGEVAHIENIMAREYKERATRRLKRNESQTTISNESEKEKLSDTTSTDRFEMQNEVSKILQEAKDFSGHASFSVGWGKESTLSPKFQVNTAANYATHSSKEESARQAVTEAQDITARALDRIVTKTKEERIDKILEEYEENNKHGFDNTKGSGHVVGVYRWVDKVLKNQIYNYGKRMMFEFMIPEPAKLHSLGLEISETASETLLSTPIDPRKSSVHKLDDFTSLEDDVKLKYWLSKFNVEADEKFVGSVFTGTSFDFFNQDANRGCSKTGTIKIPDGYVSTEANISFTGMHSIGNWDSKILVSIGNKSVIEMPMRIKDSQTYTISNFTGEMPVTFAVTGYHTANATVNVKCDITQEGKNAWLQKTFNAIITAYEDALLDYNSKLEAENNKAVVIKGSNPNFYRQIENTILRKNCISYMADRALGSTHGYGLSGLTTGNTFTSHETVLTSKLDQYTAFVKFMEQAFEWENLSYNLYPYYWGDRNNWGGLYQQEDIDPIFRAFLQSGMARTVVTVRPGFENAVQFYLATGKIWNGGEVPVIGDELYLSLIDEMKEPKGTKIGEPWREKLPTSLTVLQADSIGLKVEKALPCNCEPGVKFDDNLGEMCGSNFELNNNQIGQSGDKWMEISFQGGLNNYLETIKDMDDYQVFPRKYECLGNIITIDRDASWLGTQSSEIVLKTLAEEISQIEGVEARSTGNNGVTFKINVSKIKNFSFTKPGSDNFVGGHELLKFSVDLDNAYLKMASPEYDRYGNERILDKDGQVIPQTEYLEKAPLSKFLL